MLDLREEYINEEALKQETICGFTVSQEMKRVWAAEMKVLAEVVKICERHNITYYADYGTLLGTVRHKGFIPWDDDIDICLKRDDYMKLIGVLKEELPDNYFVSSCYTNSKHKQPWTTVSNYQKLPVPENIQKNFYNCPYVIGIDIYMLDYMPRDANLKELWINMYTMVYDFTNRYDEIIEEENWEKYIDNLQDLCNVKLINDSTLRNQLFVLQDRIASMFKEEESDYLTLLPRLVQADTDFKYEKYWFDDIIKMDFNGMKINVASGYDEILKNYYGNYMEYTVGQCAHDYPVYAKQKEFLEAYEKVLKKQ